MKQRRDYARNVCRYLENWVILGELHLHLESRG